MSDGQNHYKRCVVHAMTRQGYFDVQAIACGKFAVHEFLKSITLGGVITHRQTGRQVGEPFASKERAISAARTMDLDAPIWNFHCVPSSPEERQTLRLSMINAGVTI